MIAVPEKCQQSDCTERAETWCPLCERFFCLTHDELYPARCHDCLGGPADADLVSARETVG
jgi:hypothetical protein